MTAYDDFLDDYSAALLAHLDRMIEISEGAVKDNIRGTKSFRGLHWLGRVITLFYVLLVFASPMPLGLVWLAVAVGWTIWNEHWHRDQLATMARRRAYWQEGADLYILARTEYLELGTYPDWLATAAQDHSRRWSL